MICSRIPCTSIFISSCDIFRHPTSNTFVSYCLSSVIPSWIGSENSLLTTIDKLQLSPPQKLPVSFVFILYAAHYLPVYGIISWCSMCPLLQTSDRAKFILEIQATCTSYVHSTRLLGCIHKILNYEWWNLRQNFWTEFVDPVENTGILIDEFNQIVSNNGSIISSI